MPRCVHVNRPLELFPTRVAWEQAGPESLDVVSVSVDRHQLVFDVNGTSASTYITPAIADALLALIAPHTGYWEGVAQQLVNAIEPLPYSDVEESGCEAIVGDLGFAAKVR